MNEAAVKDSYPASGLHVHAHTRTHTHANTHSWAHTQRGGKKEFLKESIYSGKEEEG